MLMIGLRAQFWGTLTCQDDAYRNKRRPGIGFRSLAPALRLSEVLESEELAGAITLLADGDQENMEELRI